MTEAAAVVSKVGGMVEGMKGREGGREGGRGWKEGSVVHCSRVGEGRKGVREGGSVNETGWKEAESKWDVGTERN